VLALVACGSPAPSPYPARTPAPLPSGAVPLAIETAEPRNPTAGVIDTCPRALMEPVRLARLEDRLVFLLVDSGAARSVVWPRGFSARVRDGRAELVAPDGSIVASEGDILENVGGAGSQDGAFGVCSIGGTDYGPAS
jgi:hypothetical protein